MLNEKIEGVPAPLSAVLPALRAKDYALFFAIALLYPLYQLALNPDWMLGGQMWAEMATNYYANAAADTWAQRLFALDAGYFPIPQRIIAAICASLGVPSVSVPFVYTWSATILTGIIVSTFTLPVFRAVLRPDTLRAIVTLTVLLVADFETRTFINFTYFGGFLAVTVTALALALGKEDVPRWVWIVPVFFLSKPAVLAALPAMIAVAFVAGNRFRWIALVSFVLGSAQTIRLLISRSE